MRIMFLREKFFIIQREEFDMKKMLSVLLASVMVLGTLTGCGSKAEEAATEAAVT